MKKAIRIAQFVLILALLAMYSTSARAQALYGSLTGNVTDPSNAQIAGAKVEVRNVGTNTTTQGMTDTAGVYLINYLIPGMYRVTISAQGFATIVQENVRIDVNNERRADVQMQVGTETQNVTVSAAPTALQTDTTDVKTDLSSTVVSNLPLGNNRNYETLLTVVPGVAPPREIHSFAGNATGSLGLQVNGLGTVAQNTIVDGASLYYFATADDLVYIVPQEAIESLNVVTGGMDAEQGNGLGSVITIAIKSGTNDLHGSAFEYNTVSALQSRNWFFYGPRIPKYVLNEYGLSLGGPIKKNKLFFFTDWEAYRLSWLQQAVISIPPQAILQGNFSSVSTIIYDPTTGNADGTGRTPFAGNMIPAARISTAAAYMANLIPAPNFGTGGIANNFQSNGDLKFNRDSVDLKINYVPSAKSTLFGRYSGEPIQINNPQQLGPAGGAATGSVSVPGIANNFNEMITLGGTYIFRPNVLLDANVAYERVVIDALNTDIGTNYGLTTLKIPGTNGTNPLQGGYPAFLLSSLSGLGNSSTNSPSDARNNQYIYAANLIWIKATHSFRFGMEGGRYDTNTFATNVNFGMRGGFSFTGGVSALKGGSAPNAYNSWADFLLGLPTSLGKDVVYVVPNAVRANQWSFYARDNWQVSKKLSIDYGVRYEAYPVATNRAFGSLNYDINTNAVLIGGLNGVPRKANIDTGLGQLVPRLGIAYRLNEKTVIRSGFVMSPDNWSGYSLQSAGFPSVVSLQLSGANSFSPAGSLTAPFVGPTAPAGLNPGIPSVPLPDLTKSLTLPQNVGAYFWPQKIRRGYVEGWNLAVQRDLGKNFNVQAGYVANHAVRLMGLYNYNTDGPGQGTAGLPLYQSFGNANFAYNILPSISSNYESLQTQLMRRVAGSLLGIVYTYSKAIDNSDQQAATFTFNYQPVFYRNRAIAGFDRKHNLEMYGVFNSPFGHNQRWVTRGVGAAILGDWTFSPMMSRESGMPFTVTSSGASLNAPNNTQTADQVKPKVAILGGHGPNSPYFDPLAFAPVTAVRFGTSGRDSVRGPGYFNINASLIRSFRLTERFRVEFRTDVTGLTNTPNFANPGATVSNATFSNGAVTNYGGYDIISSTFQPYGLGDRQVRFALHLLF